MGLFDILFRKTYEDKNGYMRFCDSGKSVHRWNAEKKLCRKLKKGEVVHHKDRNKKNNAWPNLHVFRSQREHDRAHQYDAMRYGKDYSYKGKRESTSFWADWF